MSPSSQNHVHIYVSIYYTTSLPYKDLKNIWQTTNCWSVLSQLFGTVENWSSQVFSENHRAKCGLWNKKLPHTFCRQQAERLMRWHSHLRQSHFSIILPKCSYWPCFIFLAIADTDSKFNLVYYFLSLL